MDIEAAKQALGSWPEPAEADPEELLWREVLDEGDLDALRQLADTLNGLDERELGAGD